MSSTLTDHEESSNIEEPEKSEIFDTPHNPNETTEWNGHSKGCIKVQEDAPIVYQYLTFETEPPVSLELPFNPNDTGSLSQPPDLRQYESPFTWSASRKSLITWLSCVVTAFTAYTAGSYSAASVQISQEWDVSIVATYVGITTFTTGFGIAPMILAPFSEINGRKPVFVATGILFVICQLCCAVTRSFPGMLVARFFVGVGGSTFSTMVGGVISDIYHTEDRNTPMALFSGAALFGTGLGPVVGTNT
ncbi:hypothetical protein MMC14_001216 [Varicellaria rhodocarpa]|nr:hypothetical protein [Varicellaria rhodocarpa]